MHPEATQAAEDEVEMLAVERVEIVRCRLGGDASKLDTRHGGAHRPAE
jgi:hypothetical protein